MATTYQTGKNTKDCKHKDSEGKSTLRWVKSIQMYHCYKCNTETN